MTPKAKDGRETLQERRMSVSEAKALGYKVDETVNPILAYKGPRFRPAEHLLVISDELAEAQAEIARREILLEDALSDARRLYKEKCVLLYPDTATPFPSSAPTPASAGARDEARLAKAVVAAAREMPRATPAPGGSETVHDFQIPAWKVWRLDSALTAYDKGEPIPDPSSRAAGLEEAANVNAVASAQDLVKALEQIRVVCLDNTASERPDLALKFVSEVAEKALSATGGAK